MIRSIGKRAVGFVSIAIATSFISFANGSLTSSCAAEATKSDKNDSGALHPYNPNALHRLDFRVEGKSCAVCLHRMQERMKAVSGTVKVEVMLKKPFGAVVLYDFSKVKSEQILEKCKEGLPEVTLKDVKDVAIKKIPLILVPAAAGEATDEAE